MTEFNPFHLQAKMAARSKLTLNIFRRFSCLQ